MTDFSSNKNIMMKKNDSIRCDIRGLDGNKIIENHMSATSMKTDREEYDLSTEHSPEYFMTHSGTLEGCERGSAFRTGHNLNLHENENFNNNFNENLHENSKEKKNINKEFHFNIDKNGNDNNNIINNNNNSNLNNNNHVNNDVNIKNESTRIDGSTINYSLGKFSPDYYGSHNPVKNINNNINQNNNYYNQKESSKENHNENQNENKSESEGSALCGPSSSLIR